MLLGIVVGSSSGILVGTSVFFLLSGVVLLPAGYYAWKDDNNVIKVDADLPTFVRSVGNVAGSTGVTLTEAMNRSDRRSMGSLEPHLNDLHTRLTARLPTKECWEKFREETGSELASRATTMLVDGSELGGRADLVGQICSDFTQNVTQLRAKRQLTSSTFSFLTVPMHGTMVFILVFVLEIIRNFNGKLAEASTESAGQEVGTLDVSPNLLPAGIGVPEGGQLTGGLDIFGNQDMTLIAQMIVLVIVILTVANSLAPKFAAGRQQPEDSLLSQYLVPGFGLDSRACTPYDRQALLNLAGGDFMGEATFTKPFVNWMERRRAKKAAKEAEHAEPEHIDAVSHSLGGASASQREETPEPPAAEPLPAAGAPPLVDEGTDQLPLNVRDAFTAAAPVTERTPPVAPPSEHGFPSVSRVSVESATVEAQEEESSPEPPPVQRVSVEASAEEGAAEAVSAVRPVEQPAPQQRPQSGTREVLDSMPASLRDIFRKKTATNPQVKALLKRHGMVDARDLTEQLNEFAKSIGATGEDSDEG